MSAYGDGVGEYAVGFTDMLRHSMGGSMTTWVGCAYRSCPFVSLTGS